MHRTCARGLSSIVAALLLTSWNVGFAEHPNTHPAKSWLDSAASEKQCPSTPVNVRSSNGKNDLLKRIKISNHTLVIEGTNDPDHIVISSGADNNLVYVTWNDKQLGRFGPVTGITMRGNGGDDVLIAKRNVALPVLFDGGDGDDCLQGGSGADTLLAGAGDDVLIAGTGRPALIGGTGRDRVVVPYGMGTLHYGPSADAGVLRSLRQIYNLEPARDEETGRTHSSPGPLILGSADLGNEKLLKLAKRVRAAGETVAVTEATEAQAEQLRVFLHHPNAATERGSKSAPTADIKLPLITFRTAQRPGTKGYDYSVGSFDEIPKSLDDWSTQLLSREFSATAVVPRLTGANPSNDLQKIANSYSSHATAKTQSGDTVHIVDSVWAVRSFLNQSDFYYVFQEVDYKNVEEPIFPLVFDGVQSAITSFNQPAQLIQPSPQTTQCSDSTTSGVTWNIGGSAGWSGVQGLDAALTGGVSVTNSTTITCPSTLIKNEGDPGQGKTQWAYTLSNVESDNLASFYNQWIWQVPFSNYAANTQNLAFAVNASMEFNGGPALVANLTSTVPLPFGSTFTLQDPVVSSVNPTCVNAGNNFTVSGSGLYPSLVSAVLIDGTPLSANQYSSVNDTSIKVTAPYQSGYDQPVVVQTGVGISNSNVGIEISTLGLCSDAASQRGRTQ